jgi:hypothetical protein
VATLGVLLAAGLIHQANLIYRVNVVWKETIRNKIYSGLSTIPADLEPPTG